MEMGSILCFLRYLLLNLEAVPFRTDAADFFSRAFRLCFGRGDDACRHLVLERIRSELFESMNLGLPNQITGANTGQSQRLTAGSRGLSRVIGPAWLEHYAA